MNLTTRYMGLTLKNPLIASASPLTGQAENIRWLEDAGASAVVMFSLFEEQLRHEQEARDHLLSAGSNSFAESLDYFPQVDDFKVGPDAYLNILRRATEIVDIPVIASLNGVTSEGWVDYAKQMQQAGAAAIELNVYYIATDPALTGRDVEQRYIDVLKAVKFAVTIPVAIKLGPFFSAFGNMARQLDEAGADALVLFNRFYQPDFDIEKLQVVPSLKLSTANEIRLPLLWIAVLHKQIKASLAATGGVASPVEVIKYLLAGADAVMTTSALLREGMYFMKVLVDGLSEWMSKKGYESVEQMKGSMSQQHVADPAAFERANYIKVLESYKNRYLA
jgi:dihydroorotate dehydrogenase (fumarate)